MRALHKEDLKNFLSDTMADQLGIELSPEAYSAVAYLLIANGYTSLDPDEEYADEAVSSAPGSNATRT